MEKPLIKYHNRLRNSLTVIYWGIIWFYGLWILTESNFIDNQIYFLIASSLLLVFLWPVNYLRTYIYNDAIVFKELGFRPRLVRGIGIAFENLHHFRYFRIVFNLYYFVFYRTNGKTIRKVMSFSDDKLIEISKILNEKIKNK
ncbi:hypothetical protein DF185_02230 [Marinifilum breve]|uniref:DUF304 domain-containing protein n=1 Tax=Marinifilum breve TaxID=2184082 RepID=A0A2V4A3U8_9BACT|nr:hypothetical protein DF185_02230 [Marinifilum breve]